MVCTKNGKYNKWYVTCGSKCAYIPKECRGLAEQLAYRRYLEEMYLDMKDEVKLMKLQSRYSERKYRHIELLQKQGFMELLKDRVGVSGELRQWQEEDYIGNPYYSNELKIKVHDKLFVRSKSESMIAVMLMRYQIPFRYECQLHLANKVVYPDFTILHPKTKRIIYWEHFGMTDNYKYCRDNYNKLIDYCGEDIWLGENLILTSETRSAPLNYETIENRIREFLL